MKIAIIPARLGSKRIKEKNIKLFFRKPIISYVIQEVQKTKIFDELIVSTESYKIKNIAEKYGAKVPFMRTRTLSNNKTPIRKVVVQAINKIEKLKQKKVETVFCIFPTSVLISSLDILKIFKNFKKKKRYMFAACKYAHPIQRSFSLKRNNNPKAINKKLINVRTQDLTEYYHDAGQFYIGSRSHFLGKTNIFSNDAFPILFNRNELTDIDTLEDWEEAKIKYRLKYKN